MNKLVGIILFLFLLPLISQAFGPHRGSNRLFLDTAIVSEWKALMPLGIFHGITTNPTLLERANHDCTVSSVHSLIHEALSMIGCEEFMCQAWGSDAEEMYQIGMKLSEVDRKRVVIKVPITFEGTKAASKLINAGVRVCLTACYSSDQAIIAAGLGAEYLAPYLGRMNDAGKDGMEECKRMQDIVNGMGSSTRIIVASIRDVKSMGDLMSHGMDTFTFSPDVARDLFREQLTIAAANDFEAAAKRGGGGAGDDDGM
jgi:transaldolase